MALRSPENTTLTDSGDHRYVFTVYRSQNNMFFLKTAYLNLILNTPRNHLQSQRQQLTSPSRGSLSAAASFSFRPDTSVSSSSFWVSRLLRVSSS